MLKENFLQTMMHSFSDNPGMFTQALRLKAGMYLKSARKMLLLANGQRCFWFSKYTVNTDKKYGLKRLFSLLD